MAVFIPGTTPEWTATLNVPASTVEKVIITFSQGRYTVCELECTSFTESSESECSFSFSLTQEESLKFSDNEDIRVQCNALMKDSGRCATAVITLRVGTQLHRKVIDNE